MALVDRLDHLVFRDFLRACLDHDDLGGGGCNGQLKIALIPLLLGRVYDELTVDQAHLGHGAGAVKGDIGDAGCDGGAEHGYQLRSALRVYAHDKVVERDIIAVILREERAHGTVDDSCRKNSILTGLSLSLIESAGHLADGIILLFKIDGKREEINAFTGFLGCGGSTQNSGITIMHECRAVCLGCYSADVNTQCPAGDLHGKSFSFLHGNSFR